MGGSDLFRNKRKETRGICWFLPYILQKLKGGANVDVLQKMTDTPLLRGNTDFLFMHELTRPTV